MDNLPFELYPLIFQHLTIYDLINCALTCKRIAESIKYFQIDELIINNNNGIIDIWFYSNRLPNYGMIIFNNLNILKTTSFNLINLRRLKISYSVDVKQKFELKILNNFKQLVECEIKLKRYKSDEIIELNSLQILSINLFDSTFKELIAPKLKALYLDYYYSPEENILDSVLFRTPLTVIYLEHNGCYRDLNLFKNVEIFKTPLEIFKDIFILFPKIKEVHFANCFDHGYSNEDLGLFLNDIAYIDSVKEFYDKQDLIYYFFSVRFSGESSESINSDDFYLKRFFMQMNNYNLLSDKLNWVTKLNYENLTNYIDNLPDNWYDKFANLQKIYAKNIKNQNQFIKFINNLKNLNKLELNESNLDQIFFNHLSSISTLTQLNLIDKKDLQLDFNFIHQIKLLRIYKSNQKLSIKKALNCFIKLRFLVELSIINTGEQVSIYKENNYYHLNCCKNNYKKKFNYDKLIKYINKLDEDVNIFENTNCNLI